MAASKICDLLGNIKKIYIYSVTGCCSAAAQHVGEDATVLSSIPTQGKGLVFKGLKTVPRFPLPTPQYVGYSVNLKINVYIISILSFCSWKVSVYSYM